jgi:hypothetical protein
MNRILKRIAILLLPLVAIVGIVFAMYGPSGPPETPRTMEVGRTVGMAYGFYCAAMIFYWWKLNKPDGRAD